MMKYYSLHDIDSRNCDYNFLVSGRGPGKSTAIVNHLIDDYVSNGKQFVRIARYDWEVSKTLMQQWFNAVNISHLQESLDNYELYVEFKGGVFYVTDGTDSYTMGYVVTLNNQDIFKSASYDNVTNIVFEEFVQMNERDYIKGEIELFLSAVSTIVRSRNDCRVWFIGNTLSKHNPYFDFFGIDIDRLGISPGDLRTFRCAGFAGLGATVAIEYVQMSYEDIGEIPALMRIGGNITATSGLYAIQPTVSEYKDRTDTLLDTDFRKFLPMCEGAYIGDGIFCKVRVTNEPRYDDMRLLSLSLWDVTPYDLSEQRFLNLSGMANPRYSLFDNWYHIRCISPYPIWSDTRAMRKLQIADSKCVHAYETDEMRYKWRNFIDAYGYEKGEI